MNATQNEVNRVAAEIIAKNAAREHGAHHVLRIASQGFSPFHSPELNRAGRELARRHPFVAHLYPEAR